MKPRHETNAGDQENGPEIFIWPPRMAPAATAPVDKNQPNVATPEDTPRESTRASGSLTRPAPESSMHRSHSAGVTSPRAAPKLASSRAISASIAESSPENPSSGTSSSSQSSPPHANTACLAFQRIWLDLVTPPLAQRLALADWTADAPHAYCQYCGHTIGPHEADLHGCRNCVNSRLPWRHMIRLGGYEPPLSTIIHEIKFTKWRRLGIDAGRLLGEVIRQQIELNRTSLGALLNRPPLLVPVPTSLRRRFQRGIDHTRTIVRGAASVMPCQTIQALGRSHRPTQLKVASHLRSSNVAGTMWLKVPPERLAGRLVIVIDDVTTTGATLRAATNAIAGAFKAPKNKSENGQHGEPAKRDLIARLRTRLHPGAPSETSFTPPTIWTAVIAVTEKKNDVV